PSQRRSLPEHFVVARVLRVERSFAVGQAPDDCAGTFFAKNIAVREPIRREDMLDDAGEPSRRRAEETMARFDDFLGGIYLRARRRSRKSQHTCQRKQRCQNPERYPVFQSGKHASKSPSGSDSADAFTLVRLFRPPDEYGQTMPHSFSNC